MELNKHICNQLVEKDSAFAQITLDDDYIVRDNKPDILRAIYTKGMVTLEDIKLGNQVVWITTGFSFTSRERFVTSSMIPIVNLSFSSLRYTEIICPGVVSLEPKP